MNHIQVVPSLNASESVNNNFASQDHSPLSFDELKKVFSKMLSLEFDMDICKEAYYDCMNANVTRINFQQELLKRTIQLTPTTDKRNAFCNDHYD